MGCVHAGKLGNRNTDDGAAVSVKWKSGPSNAKEFNNRYGYVGSPDNIACNISRAFVSMLQIINCDMAQGEYTPVCQVGYVEPASMFSTRCKLSQGGEYVDLYFVWIRRSLKLIGFNRVSHQDSPFLADPANGSCMTDDVDLAVCVTVEQLLKSRRDAASLFTLEYCEILQNNIIICEQMHRFSPKGYHCCQHIEIQRFIIPYNE